MNDTKNKNLSGALFKNDKGDNANRPDYKGTYTDDQGNEFWVSAWVKESAKGVKYMSLAMQPKEGTGATQAPSPSASQDSEDLGLPF